MAVRAPEVFAEYLRQRDHRAGVDGLARPGLPDHLSDQRGEPRRRRPDGPPRLSSGLPLERGGRPLPRARSPVVAGPDPAGCRRALRHARRERPDDVPAALAEVRRRLPRLAPAGVRRVLRRPLHPDTAREGGCCLLRPRALPRRRAQPVRGHQAHGKSNTDLLGVGSRHGDRGPGAHGKRSLSGAG